MGKNAAQLTNQNPHDRLRNCKDASLIDGILSDIGLVDNLEKRLFYLYNVMGVKQVFGSNELTLSEKYAVAKEELSSQVWKQFQ